ncbi:MAG TPA: serine/threonine-protein kinase [Nannocystaceae bacterium]|nr:serine/threonine-protein kinase [Nannocystaceae bacterium]
MSSPSPDTEGDLASAPTLPSDDIQRVRQGVLQRLFGDPGEPTRLGRYEFRRHIGQGGMGTVHAAWDPRLGREVAVKVVQYHAQGRSSEAMIARLVREAQAMARISHPNVVDVYDVGHAGTQLFFAMELVVGSSLDRWLTQRRRTTAEILAVFDAIAAGVAAAHRVGLLHRDLKPANVLVGDDGRVRVADFGLARVFTPDTHDDTRDDAGAEKLDFIATHDADTPIDAVLTAHGAAVGTPAFMSPEQQRGDSVDARTDVYAFCVALYFALCERLPFTGSSAAALYVRKTEGELAWPSTRRDLPGWLTDVIARGLRPNPADRFASMDELRAALRRGTRSKRAGPVVFVAATAVLLAGIAMLPARDGCDGVTEPMTTLWTPARADELGDAFARVADRGRERAAPVVAAFDAWTRAWIDARTKLCKSADAGTSEGDARVACLERQRSAFAAALDRLGRPDAGTIARAREFGASLPAPSDCLADDFDDASQADDPRVVALAQRLELVDAARLAGRITEHVGELRAIAAEADALDDADLRIRAHIRLGQALRGVGQAEAALPELETAYALAYERGRGEREAEAALTLAITLGKQLRRSDEARRWMSRANAAVERYALSPETAAIQAADASGIELAAGDIKAALAHAERAVALARALPDRRALALALYERATAEAKSGKPNEALASREQSIAAFEESLGPDHPNSIATHVNLAHSLRDVGRPEDAERELELVVSRLEGIYGVASSRFVIAASELGSVRIEVLHDPARAAEAYARAVEGARQLHGVEDAELVAGVLGNYGDALWALGEYERALVLHRSSFERYEDIRGPEFSRAAGQAMFAAHDAIALGDDELARSFLRRAATIGKRIDNAELLAHVDFAEAVMLRNSDPAHARVLAESARDRFAKLGGPKSELVEQWTAALEGRTPLPADWKRRAIEARLAVVP